MEKKDSSRQEIKRLKVPLGYGSKEKYVALLQGDPENKKSVKLELPRMSFMLEGISYDPTRAQQQMLQDSSAISGNSTKLTTKFVPSPFNLNFSLSIMTREVDDGLQILEQIAYYFRPDYTVSINFEPLLGVVASKETPIILTDTQMEDNTVGPVDEIRMIVWTLSFTMKSYLYGPTKQQGQIMHVFVNYYDNTVDSRTLSNNGIIFTANTTKGSNIVVLSANVPSVVTANSLLKIDGTLIVVKSINGANVTGNVIMSATEKFVNVDTVILPNTRVAAYTANVVPPTALVTDNYTIAELFQDFS